MVLEEYFREHLEHHHRSLRWVVDRLPAQIDISGVSVDPRFHYLPLVGTEPDITSLIDYLISYVIDYCVPYSVQRRYFENPDLTVEEIETALISKAVRKFVETPEARELSGEPGELALAVLLESECNAPQIAVKMWGKDNHNAQVKGTDAIHAAFGGDGVLELYWGESKLHKSRRGAMRDFCNSINNFVGAGTRISSRSDDLDYIVDKHLTLPDGPARNALLGYFNVYSDIPEPKPGLVRECYAGLIGYDYKGFYELLKDPGKDPAELFLSLYAEEVRDAGQAFCALVKEHNLQALPITLFLLPFKSLADFRDQFYVALDRLK